MNHEVIGTALKIATEAHEGQYRWDGVTPYIEHPTAVAGCAIALYNSFCLLSGRPISPNDETVIISAAYLHDVIEDCGYTYSSLRDKLSELGVDESFDVLISKTVFELSRGDDASYEEFIFFIAGEWSFRAVLIKMADIKSNLNDCYKDLKGDLSNKDRKYLEKLVTKYRLSYRVLFNGLGRFVEC